MKKLLPLLAVILFAAYLADQRFYHGYHFRSAGDISWQIAGSFGFRR